MGSKFWDERLAARLTRHERFEYEFPERPLTGKVILVPGGSGGLGAATVALLVREGVRVVVGYRENRARAERLAVSLNERGPGSVTCVEGDLRTAAARERLIEVAEESSGELYGLVSFVGDPARIDLAQLDEKAVHESLEVNYVAPLLLAKQVGERLQARHTPGSLVLIATMQAVAPFEGSVNYAAPKAALLHAARILARQWGSLRVNVVAPGVTLSGMALASIQAGKYDNYVREKTIPRFGYPEDVARVVRLLLEPDNYLTGQVITVDGGLTLRRGLR
jgi:NAD(P)-dependent dehydrogenase (short-subunit alcohol dehydrogenase family)